MARRAGVESLQETIQAQIVRNDRHEALVMLLEIFQKQDVARPIAYAALLRQALHLLQGELAQAEAAKDPS